MWSPNVLIVIPVTKLSNLNSSHIRQIWDFICFKCYLRYALRVYCLPQISHLDFFTLSCTSLTCLLKLILLANCLLHRLQLLRRYVLFHLHWFFYFHQDVLVHFRGFLFFFYIQRLHAFVFHRSCLLTTGKASLHFRN